MSEREQKAFTDLVAVCRRLRGPDGCPWDKEQTLQTMTPYLTEEAVESAEASESSESAPADPAPSGAAPAGEEEVKGGEVAAHKAADEEEAPA